MDPKNQPVPMPILTPRLQIRPRRAGEGQIVAKAVNESLETLKPWMPFAQEPMTAAGAEEHIGRALINFQERTDFVLSIYDREGKTFIGSTGFHHVNWDVPSFMIGYWVHKDHEGKGYITETVNALTRYAFTVFKANRLEITCDSKNQRSLAVMKRLGFVQEGLLKNEERNAAGELRDTIITARYDMSGLAPLEVVW